MLVSRFGGSVKFENIMFETTADNSEVKVIDFGLSKKFRPGDQKKTMTEGVGTVYTMAPQVLQGVYTSQADLWSLGVITFMLLASQKPFHHKKKTILIDRIMRNDYAFEGEIWKSVSDESKDFITHLLVLDPQQRMDADTALKHKWLSKEYNLSDRRPDEELMKQVENNLVAYKHASALKKVALNVIAHKSSPHEIYQLRKAFQQYDIENNGVISFHEFKEALKLSNYSDKELEEIFASIDVNVNGHIMYTGKSPRGSLTNVQRRIHLSSNRVFGSHAGSQRQYRSRTSCRGIR
jgi:calcium-dependent protein kinase